MAAKKRLHFYEPWTASLDSAWKGPFRFGPPSYSSVPPEDREILLSEWEGQKGRAEKNADMLILGSRMSEPHGTCNLAGIPGFHDGSEILIRVRNRSDWPERGPNHKQVAERIAACVTAMAGVGNPADFIRDVRSLLLDLAKGEFCDDPRDSPRIWGLLSSCIPPEELTAFNTGDHVSMLEYSDQ